MFSSGRVGPARAACAGPPTRRQNHWWAGATKASLVPPYNTDTHSECVIVVVPQREREDADSNGF